MSKVEYLWILFSCWSIVFIGVHFLARYQSKIKSMKYIVKPSEPRRPFKSDFEDIQTEYLELPKPECSRYSLQEILDFLPDNYEKTRIFLDIEDLSYEREPDEKTIEKQYQIALDKYQQDYQKYLIDLEAWKKHRLLSLKAEISKLEKEK